MTPTYSGDTWRASEILWRSFSPAWNALRQRAALAFSCYPPSGTEHDDRDAARPSQRAVIARCLRDNPVSLYAIVGRSRSWSEVVEKIIGLESRLRDEARASESALTAGGGPGQSGDAGRTVFRDPPPAFNSLRPNLSPMKSIAEILEGLV